MLAFLAAVQIALPAVDSTPRPISQLAHTRWTTREGAPAEIRALAQTTDGYLWIGTLSGLVRFDGVRFVPFSPQRGDTVPNAGARALLGSRDGSLWVVWRTGSVSHLRNRRITSYGERDGLPVTFRIAESSTGAIVAGTASGLSRFVDGKWTDVSREWGYPGTESRAVWFDREGALWSETENRVVYLPAGARQFVDPGMPLKTVAAPAEFAEARDGSIWMAELLRSAHIVPRNDEDTPVSEVMVGTFTLLIDRRGSLWVGSAGDGLRRVLDPTALRGKKIAQFGPEAEQYTEKDGLLGSVVYALLEDREGNIWVATARGIERFREGPFTPITTQGSVRSRWLQPAKDSSIWTAAFGVDGILRIRGSDQELVRSTFLWTSFFQDSAGVIWTLDTDKIMRLDGRRPVRFSLRPGPAHRLGDITIDRSGTIWVYDEEVGLLRLSGDSLVRVAAIAQSVWPHGTLFSDRQGRIWVAQMNRVALYDQGKLSLFGPSDGVPPGVVNSFYEDRAGNLWATGEGGLSKFEGRRFRRVLDHKGLPGGSVYGMVEDDEGGWWIVNSKGAHLLPPGELDRALSDSNYTIKYRSFDTYDGLPGTVVHSSWGPLIARNPDRRIWVATDSGLASVDPRNVPLAPAAPVLIETVRIGGRELAPSEGLAIPPGTRDIEIDYTATSLSAPDRVQFRYRLEGQDATWRDVGNRRRAYYSGLGPGSYQFRVIASNSDGVWNETGAVLGFRVLPAWYQTLWFRGLAIVLIGALGAAAAALLQRRRHVVLKREYEATLAERARIAQDLHDTLLQGFAGVTLQLKAAELALPEEPDVAAETILRVQRLARESLREARDRVWEMRATEIGSDDLPAALEAMARERTMGTGIEVSVASSGRRRRLTRPVEDAVFRIGREAVVNVVRHAQAKRIEIHVEFGATNLRLDVCDDGRGFTPQDAEAAHRNGHFGLSGARERAARMGGTFDVRARPGGGTIVALELPLAERAAR